MILLRDSQCGLLEDGSQFLVKGKSLHAFRVWLRIPSNQLPRTSSFFCSFIFSLKRAISTGVSLMRITEAPQDHWFLRRFKFLRLMFEEFLCRLGYHCYILSTDGKAKSCSIPLADTWRMICLFSKTTQDCDSSNLWIDTRQWLLHSLKWQISGTEQLLWNYFPTNERKPWNAQTHQGITPNSPIFNNKVRTFPKW